MPDQIYIGNFAKGLTLNRLPFNIDNDSFPTMYNFYSWRGRAKRKRGTIFLGQLEKQVESNASPNQWQVGIIMTLDVSGNGTVNLISHFSLGTGSTITPGSISLSDGTNTFTEPATPNGTLIGVAAGTGTINYSTGVLSITGGASMGTVVGDFSYFPGLPIMGLRDFDDPASSSQYPLLLAFDTDFAYQINQNSAEVFFYNVSFYKETNNPVIWTGQDFQLFWTTNYSGALWATNNVPGFQFEPISAIIAGTPTQITTAIPHGLITGDYVWFNEITGTDAGLLNGQTFQITKIDATNFTVPVTTATINNDGIFQTLTAKSTTSSGDGIRWYDGDPTGGTGLPTSTGKGWVNFSPPLTATSVSIDNRPSDLYYLVGALAILPFKDRLLFFGPWIQTSSGNAIRLQDTVLWSWNGTPYYTSLVPSGETFNITAYYQDQTGKGGNLPAGISQPIVTINNNEDVLIIGFTGRQTRFVYTSNDLFPFLFYNINQELGSSSTFSSISLDRGGLSIGANGIVLTTQESAQRIDLPIPDSVFQIQALNQGVQRVNAIRDFFKEWIYFTYPVNNSQWKYPTQTFLYNYRDNTWSILYENFTAQGNYRKQSGYTWATIGQAFPTWAEWNESWNSGSISSFFPAIVGGNPQGYVLIKGEGTGEGRSGNIINITNHNGYAQITSYNHCVTANNSNLDDGDYLYIQGCLGTTAINNQVARVINVIDSDNFVTDLAFPAGTYLGLGKYSKLSQPLLQTKQFPFYWEQGRKLRLGVQQYLLDRTVNGQITVDINLSQDPDSVWNSPNLNKPPSSLIYSQLVYTCPESTNIGLTPSNTNLQMPTASTQKQIWHRYSTSLIGDSVQLGFTLNSIQMKDYTLAIDEITLHGIILTVYPSSMLA